MSKFVGTVFALFLAVAMWAGGASAATTSDCTASGWAKAYLPTPDYSCVEIERRDFKGSAEVVIRVTRDAALPAERAEGVTSLLLDAAAKSLDAYGSLAPNKRIFNVTFLVFGTPTDDDWWANVGEGDECFISISVPKAEKSAKSAALAPRAVAHEVAHCVQLWWARAQSRPEIRTSALWWLEGSAEYLATRVYKSDTEMAKTISIFDAKSATVPLTQMSYEAYVFFCWYGYNFGGSAGVVQLWEKMATIPGDAAQQQALLAALGAEALNQFALDYIERNIFQSLGGAPIVHPVMGDPIYVEDEAEVQINGPPFTIMRGAIHFRSGRYAVTVEDHETPATLFSPASKVWGALPAEVEAACHASTPFRYVAFATGNSDRSVIVKAHLTEALANCTTCHGLPEHDQCLVGSWVLDTKAVENLLKPTVGNCSSGTALVKGMVRFKISAGGTQSMVMDDYGIFLVTCASLASTRVDVIGGQEGMWSTAGGTLKFCPVSGTVSFKTTVVTATPAGRVENVQSFPGNMDPQDFAYTCNGNKLTVTSVGYQLDGKPLQWVFNRQ